ncbi:MAG: Ca2+-dependent phosphoinositide-specific phospholipase C [Acidimicrobiia bacterium]
MRISKALASLAAISLSACFPTTDPTPLPTNSNSAYPNDATLRLNHIQVLGTHNSYHLRSPDLATFSEPDRTELDYAHAPLDVQLDLGVRALEIDVHANAAGHTVFHVLDRDMATTCSMFTACLEVVKSWSIAHPNHAPITIQIEPKFDVGATSPQLLWNPGLLAQLDRETRSVLGDRLITPDNVRVKGKTLRQSISQNGWPTLAQTRGRVLLYLSGNALALAQYEFGFPSLEKRAMFTAGEPGSENTAIVLKDTVAGNEAAISYLTQLGFMVRTRSDAGTREARTNDTSRATASFATGAHIISTDYPTADPIIGTPFVVNVPGSSAVHPARCNPVVAPATCAASDIE